MIFLCPIFCVYAISISNIKKNHIKFKEKPCHRPKTAYYYMRSYDLLNSVVTRNRNKISSHYIQYNMPTAIDDSLMRGTESQHTIHDKLNRYAWTLVPSMKSSWSFCASQHICFHWQMCVLWSSTQMVKSVCPPYAKILSAIT